MSLVFRDFHKPADPATGMLIDEPQELQTLLQRLHKRPPSGCELHFENRSRLTLLFRKECAMVQHASLKGLPPYLVAVAPQVAGNAKDTVAFIFDGSWTEVERRNVLPSAFVEKICTYFLTSGECWPGIEWQEV